MDLFGLNALFFEGENDKFSLIDMLTHFLNFHDTASWKWFEVDNACRQFKNLFRTVMEVR